MARSDARSFAHAIRRRAGNFARAVDGDGVRRRHTARAAPRIRTHAARQAPAQPPGKSFAYSNTGYGLLGAIIEHAADQSYEDLLRAHIFKPLALASAGFGPPAAKGQVNQPWGHYRDGDSIVATPPAPENEFPPALAPAASVHLSLADFARYATWLGTNEPRLVSAETFHHLQTPPGDSAYACGQWKTEVPGIGPVLAHTGNMGGFFGVFYTAPRRAVVVVFNVNGIAWEWLGDQIAAVAVKAAFAQ